MKNLFYLLIVVLISGCSLKQEVTDVNSYSIDFNSKNKSYKNIDKSILIEEPLVNKSFNSRSIFYSQKPYLFEEYAKNRWINLPSSMIHNSLLESFQSSNLFSLVSFSDAKIKYDYVLKTNVIKIYHEINENKSYVILKINFGLVKDKELVKTFSYDKKVLVKENKPYEFVNGLNKIFEEIMEELLKEINKL
jgi:cholesterol transport system auxiliary component